MFVMLVMFVMRFIKHAHELDAWLVRLATCGIVGNDHRVRLLQTLSSEGDQRLLLVGAWLVLEADHIHCRDHELDDEFILSSNDIQKGFAVSMRVQLTMSFCSTAWRRRQHQGGHGRTSFPREFFTHGGSTS